MNARWRSLSGLAMALVGVWWLLHTLSVVAAPAVSADGLDPTFGTGGSAAVVLPGSSQIARALARQPDGRLVVAGYTNWNTSNQDVLLARFLADGSLDTTFGTGGVVTTTVSPANDTAYAVAVQPDGRIVIAGLAQNSVALLARYLPDGSLDTAFGTGGLVTTSLPTANAFFLSLAVLSDGRLLAAGGAVPPASSSAFNQFLLARYLPDGSLDTAFGTGGVVTTTFAGDAISWGMAIQPDGKIVLGGSVNSAGNSDFALARYLPDGSLDPSFGSGGRVVQDVSADYGYSVAVQQDGRIVLGGKGGAGGTLLRYQSDGSPDLTFGPHASSNVVSYTVPGYLSTSLSDFTLGPHDEIIAVGSVYTPGRPGAFAVHVFLADGSPNVRFGVGGMVTTTYGTHQSSGRQVLLQPDGRIVVAGNADLDDTSAYDYDMVVWRYLYSPYTVYLPLVQR